MVPQNGVGGSDHLPLLCSRCKSYCYIYNKLAADGENHLMIVWKLEMAG
jgi:hypothetical protein